MKLSIIIPCYNEERTLHKLLEAVEEIDLSALNVEKEIIVIDDGSMDRTAEIIKAHPKVKSLRHYINQGKGMAIRSALQMSTGDVVLIQDADLEYDPQEYPALLQPMMEGDIDVVYGSRFLRKRFPKHMSFLHFFGNKVLTLMVRTLYGIHITDEATCYKVFRSSVLKSLRLRSQEFDFCPEVTAKLAKRGVKIVEVPISYSARSVEEGKKIAWQDGVQAVKALLYYRFKD